MAGENSSTPGRPGRAIGTTTAAIVACLLAACGTHRHSNGVSGRATFADACRSCHTLGGRRTTQGGDLRGLTIGRRAMLQFVREMPVRPRLSDTQVAAVAGYVRSVQRAPRR